MKRRFLSLSLLLFTAFVSYQTVSAQEIGEMLRFDDAPNLNVTVTEDALQTVRPDSGVADTVVFTSPVSQRSREPMSRILFNGLLSDTSVVLQVKFEMENDRWSDWQDVYTKMFRNGRFWGRLDLQDRTTRRIRYRLLSRGAKTPLRIEIYAIEGINLTYEKQGYHGVPPARETRFALQDTLPKPDVVSRQDWGANPPIGLYVPHEPFRFAQHHTAGRRVSTLAEGIAEQQFIQDFHQNGRGWQDIGYHFTIDDSGRIYEGVPPEFRGTHVGGNNTGNIGVSYMGNFEIEGAFPTEAALSRVTDLWSWLSLEYGVNPDSLFGHRDYTATACPGENFYPELPNLRNNIRRLTGFGAPYVVNPTPQPFTTEILPTTAIRLTIRDDDEGIDMGTIELHVNGELVSPQISGTENEYQVLFQPDEPFASSQNVTVAVSASDLAQPANVLSYSYRFTIEVEALHTEVQTPASMRNAAVEILGQWSADPDDVNLSDLTNGQRLLATDEDGSHSARVFPAAPEPGDYHVYMAANNTFLGESARYRFVSAAGEAHPHFAEYNNVFFRKWGRLSPTPVHFDTTQGASGFVELSGLEGLPTRLMLDALRFEKVDRLDAPTAPTLRSVRTVNRATREIEVAWYPTLEGDIAGYRLFVSDDGRTWNEPLVDEMTLDSDATAHTFTYGGNSATVYCRVVAVDTIRIENEAGEVAALLSPPSDIYGVGLQGTANILIVDNFDRNASWRLPHHPFVRSHGDALAANGLGFESCTETAVQNGDIDLNLYDVVVYFCGDDSRSDESLAAADQFRLQAYLENGGKLFISGSEIGFDFAATTSTEQARYRNLLKARYVGDISGSNRVLGAGGTTFDGLDFEYGTIESEDTYIEDFPDYILPEGGSQVALNYDNLRIAAVQFTGTYGDSDQEAQLIYVAFTFETITTPEDRAEVMQRAMQYFDVASSVAGSSPAVPERFELQQNYPNPFNPETTINYSVPADQHEAPVTLAIYNTLGQKVRTLVQEKKPAGSHSVSWDGKSDAGRPVSSGIYIYRVSVAGQTASRKMALVR